MESNTHTIELENKDGEKMLVALDVAGGLTLHLPSNGMFWLDDSGRELVKAIDSLRND